MLLMTSHWIWFALYALWSRSYGRIAPRLPIRSSARPVASCSISPRVAAVVVATYLIDLLVPALDLPEGLHRLALTAHLGQPMAGVWDAAGVVACLVLAVGGLVLGAEGLARRDLRG